MTQTGDPPPTRQLLALLARLEATTESALRAVDEDDAELLFHLVERRQQILHQAAPLLQEVVLLRQGGEAASDQEAAELRALEQAGHTVRAQDRRLLAEMALLRKQIGGELKQMGIAAAARTAYAPTTAPAAGR